MTESTHLMFIRHGETVGNNEQIAHGQSESPLNDRGIEQAKSTAEMLSGWHRTYHRIYASPLSRATNLGRALQFLEMRVHNTAPFTPSAASEVRGFSAKKNGRPGHPWTFLLACKSATRFVVVVSTAHPTRRITVALEISEKVARTADCVVGVGNVPHLLLLHLGTALAVCAVVSSPV